MLASSCRGFNCQKNSEILSLLTLQDVHITTLDKPSGYSVREIFSKKTMCDFSVVKQITLTRCETFVFTYFRLRSQFNTFKTFFS